jgi:hypothetical protein
MVFPVLESRAVSTLGGGSTVSQRYAKGSHTVMKGRVADPHKERSCQLQLDLGADEWGQELRTTHALYGLWNVDVWRSARFHIACLV